MRQRRYVRVLHASERLRSEHKHKLAARSNPALLRHRAQLGQWAAPRDPLRPLGGATARTRTNIDLDRGKVGHRLTFTYYMGS